MKTGKTKGGQSLCRSLGIAAFAILLMCAGGCGGPENPQAEKEDEDSGSCVNVDRTQVETADLEEIIQAIGSIEAFQTVAVHPETGGIIESVHFEEGRKVKKGDLLFTIDDAKIQAQLEARQAALEEAEANRENARLVYQRRQRLYEQEVGTEEARDEARTRYQALTAQVKRLKAEIESIRETLADTRVRAPFDGFTGERRVDQGQLVNTDIQLTSIVQTARLEIAFTVPERYTGQVRTGQEIRVTTAAYPDKTFSGTVDFVDPQIAPATRSLRIKARMDNPDNILRPGGFVTVELITGVRENVLTIPEEALIPTRTGYMVFAIEDLRANGREVEIGLRRPGTVEITGGLEKGETIVQAGHISLYEGAEVCPE
ncbi:MAG: efflux RND transporter periplasmic adaptor subunit [Desulfobacterales bacterium]|nr:efflux RND transporter periplasmic adaptor subunit [Desulfobacterales bacterium]